MLEINYYSKLANMSKSEVKSKRVRVKVKVEAIIGILNFENNNFLNFNK